MNYIKQILKKARHTRGLSQADVARSLTLAGHPTTRATIGHWETGERRLPPIVVCTAWARVVGVDIVLLTRSSAAGVS